MSKVSIATLKTYFEDGKEPDENKYIDLIDTLGGVGQAWNLFHTAWLNFPGIVGLWNTNYTRSQTNFHPNLLPTTLLLTGGGNITRNRQNYVPTWAFVSSASRLLAIADNAHLSFTGTESNVSNADRGMAVGGWVYPSNAGNWGVSHMGLISKWGATGNTSYLLYIGSSKKAFFLISSNGTSYESVYTDAVLEPNKWYFIVGRFRTINGYVELYINGKYYFYDTAFNSIFDGTSNFTVGVYGNPYIGYFDGRISGVFACGMHVGTNVLDEYYNLTKVIFEDQGVLGDPP